MEKYGTFLFQQKGKQFEGIVIRNVIAVYIIDKWRIIEEEAKYYKLFVFNIFFPCVYFHNWHPAKGLGRNQFQKFDKSRKLREKIACQYLNPSGINFSSNIFLCKLF